MKKLMTMVALGSVLALGCGDDEEEAAEGAEGAPEAQAEEGAGEEAAEAEEPAADQPCPDATALTVNGYEGPSLSPPTSQFADVTLDKSASFVFTSYEFEEDPQFGLSAPVGDPEAPEGGLIFSIRIDNPEQLVVGEYTDDGENAAGRISFTSMYNGSDRVLPLGDHTVRITEITDEHICGEIVPAEGASHPTVSGRFQVDKV